MKPNFMAIHRSTSRAEIAMIPKEEEEDCHDDEPQIFRNGRKDLCRDNMIQFIFFLHFAEMMPFLLVK